MVSARADLAGPWCGLLCVLSAGAACAGGCEGRCEHGCVRPEWAGWRQGCHMTMPGCPNWPTPGQHTQRQHGSPSRHPHNIAGRCQRGACGLKQLAHLYLTADGGSPRATWLAQCSQVTLAPPGWLRARRFPSRHPAGSVLAGPEDSARVATNMRAHTHTAPTAHLVLVFDVQLLALLGHSSSGWHAQVGAAGRPRLVLRTPGAASTVVEGSGEAQT
eukprot:365811-Chlamydomonas_euryale.AAC.22